MNEQEALAFLHGADWRGSQLGLSRIRELMGLLGDPQRDLRFVHVAGTNGKGSISAMLSAILTAAGYRTGLYTSPHLLRYNERIQVNGEEISDRDFCLAAEAVSACAEHMADPPTEFERLTAMALWHFQQVRCRIVVLEVGLGGRMDATNVIDAPEAAVITQLGRPGAGLPGAEGHPTGAAGRLPAQECRCGVGHGGCTERQGILHPGTGCPPGTGRRILARTLLPAAAGSLGHRGRRS